MFKLMGSWSPYYPSPALYKKKVKLIVLSSELSFLVHHRAVGGFSPSYRYFDSILQFPEDQLEFDYMCIHPLFNCKSQERFISVVLSFSACPDYGISCPFMNFLPPQTTTLFSLVLAVLNSLPKWA